MIKKTLLLIPFLFPLFASAQMDSSVLTVEGITDKMLAFLTCEIGESKDWDEYRNLFLPTAQKISINRSAPAGRQVRVMNLEEFIRRVGPRYAEDGFEEYAIGITINEFNGIANVFQSFYCRNLTGTYENRGVNSFQLVYADDRWWIASTTYTNESEDLPLPDELIFLKHRK